MKQKIIVFFSLISLITANFAHAQRIGVVLSGGGATGLAHVGVLMALEEAQIPIDYISGTSAGALVGSMYACGYSPEEIKRYILSDDFQKMARGITTKDEKFLLREKEPDASMLSVSFSKDSIFKKSLPTNFVTPSYLDYEMLRILGKTSASVNHNFDSLFVPFRCVASDIRKKESVVFRDGNLNAAVRASMTYPFYVNPIRVNGTLMFDGGLYNNFPADVIYDEFMVDYIIGSNVSYNAAPPTEDDVISQVTNMLMRPTDFSLPCQDGVIISPETDISTFDFQSVEEAIRIGYESALPYIDSIQSSIKRRTNQEKLNKLRAAFREKCGDLKITRISTMQQNNEPVSFVKSSFIRDSIQESIDEDDFTKRYFRIYATPQVKYMYPTLYKINDSSYQLNLDVKKEKPFELSVGGHFSSRPVNTAFIGLTFRDIGNGAFQLHAESYFGKFYGSTKVKADYDMPSILPFRVTPYFTLNRWDYFRSSSTFFEDAKPSFLVQNELYYGAEIGLPIKNNGKVELNFRKFENQDEYYQTLNFSSADTADITGFNGETAILSLSRNTLNRKQWASEGSSLIFNFRYVQGKEQSLSGNTIDDEYDVRKFHRWINLSLEAQKYFKFSEVFRLGLYGKTVFNSQSLFSNYTASVLATTEFSPLADSRTLFMQEYRAPQYAGAGLNIIFSINDLVDIRLDPYFFQPFRQILNQPDGSFGYSDKFVRGTFMAGGSVIFHSPVGPLRISTTYFPLQEQPFITQISFGYVLFNERAIR